MESKNVGSDVEVSYICAAAVSFSVISPGTMGNIRKTYYLTSESDAGLVNNSTDKNQCKVKMLHVNGFIINIMLSYHFCTMIFYQVPGLQCRSFILTPWKPQSKNM